jgi:metallo-beta-lactamase class B
MIHALCALPLLLGTPGPPSGNRDILATSPKAFLGVASHALYWNEPADPVRIAGPIYFVGTRGLGVYLIATPEGHILLNTGMPSSGPMIEASIRKLGFKPQDVKILLAGHAHVYQVGALAYLAKLSRAKVAMMAEEAPLLESGGKLDFQYGSAPEFRFDPVKVDRVLKDGDTIHLGSVTLTARLTPGHTKGATTFITRVTDGGKTYTVVFPNGTSINPGYRLGANPSYPGIADDYRRTLKLLESLKPDIWLDAQTQAFNFRNKSALVSSEGAAAFVDPDGYGTYVRTARERFEAALKATPAGTAPRK